MTESVHFTAAAERAQAESQGRLRRTRAVFRICLGYTVAVTLVWLYLIITGVDGGRFFGNYQVTLQNVWGLLAFLTMFWVVWSYGFYRLKYWLLKREGIGAEDLRMVFSNRLDGFTVESLLARYSERRLRVIDMIGRRCRIGLFVFISFAYVYLEISRNPSVSSLAYGLQSSLFDAMILSWWSILAFHSNGFLGHIVYGAATRVMDGIQGRANVLLIGTLWNGFKFVMIPMGFQMTKVFPPESYAVLYGFIWLSYATTDFASEIFGSLWGRQEIKVWGLGDVNRKSWVGVWSAFLCTLLLNVCLVWFSQLPAAWYVLGLVLAVVNPVVELYSPRGTDDFFMATINGVVCLVFGVLVYG